MASETDDSLLMIAPGALFRSDCLGDTSAACLSVALAFARLIGIWAQPRWAAGIQDGQGAPLEAPEAVSRSEGRRKKMQVPECDFFLFFFFISFFLLS